MKKNVDDLPATCYIRWNADIQGIMSGKMRSNLTIVATCSKLQK
jgi:hypothetical protein